MRRVVRSPLGEAANGKLCELTCEVAAAGQPPEPHRVSARKKRAEELWESRTRNQVFQEIRRTLQEIAPGSGHCMYCEVSQGTDIDHFWPKEKYPGRAFTWENYLWSCSACNSGFKGTQFPRDGNGAPLLVNPTMEDPGEHLDFSPTTGKLIGVTSKGQHTIRVLGFDRRGNLDRRRRDAWLGLQELVIRWATYCERNDAEGALGVQRVICGHPFAAALETLLRSLDEPARRALVIPECLQAIERFPEIRHWP